jgi:hypothetical protein
MFRTLSEFPPAVIGGERKLDEAIQKIASLPAVARNDKSVSSGLNKYGRGVLVNLRGAGRAIVSFGSIEYTLERIRKTGTNVIFGQVELYGYKPCNQK